jgi:Spy/CpxP family protein refolding chaperone
MKAAAAASSTTSSATAAAANSSADADAAAMVEELRDEMRYKQEELDARDAELEQLRADRSKLVHSSNTDYTLRSLPVSATAESTHSAFMNRFQCLS